MTTWKDRLRPFAEYVEKMYGLVLDMSDEDLEKLRDASEQPTETNCGWSTYRASRFISAEVNSEIARRKYERARQQDNG